jgi:hypothetical protein
MFTAPEFRSLERRKSIGHETSKHIFQRAINFGQNIQDVVQILNVKSGVNASFSSRKICLRQTWNDVLPVPRSDSAPRSNSTRESMTEEGRDEKEIHPQYRALCPRPHSSSKMSTLPSSWARILIICSAITIISSTSDSPLMIGCTSGSGLYKLQSSGSGDAPKFGCLSVQCAGRV